MFRPKGMSPPCLLERERRLVVRAGGLGCLVSLPDPNTELEALSFNIRDLKQLCYSWKSA